MATTSLVIRETLLKDPARPIPNQGVSKVRRPVSADDWRVLRFELESFVSEGEYARGLERILGEFLANQGQGHQPGAWVSGFFGSGKSHFVRVLAALWANLALPDGSHARGLVHDLSDDISGHLRELSAAGARAGGLWTASGTLSKGAASFRMAVLGILLDAAGLPPDYAPAMFVLWLRQQGLEAPVQAALEAQGYSLAYEAPNMYVSAELARALLDAYPDLGDTVPAVLARLEAQFVRKTDIDDAELVRLSRQILASVSTDSRPDWSQRKLPATLLVLDELQQYIADFSDRSLEVQTTVERLQSELDGQVMVVATGQAALQSTPNLQKLIARFRIQVQLRSHDVDEVVRKVILEKAPAHIPALITLLDESAGEIDRHLQGTRIAARQDEHARLWADYPLLPTRRRFWEAVLRAVDTSGAGGELRSQLHLTHDATAKVADRPLGWAIPGDAIFDELRAAMQNSGVLSNEISAVISAQRDAGGADGVLRERVLELVFLINQVHASSGGGIADTGLLATSGVIADLLVEDLTQGSARLRDDVARVLEQLADDGLLMALEGQYRLQTQAGQEWENDYRARLRRFRNDDARIASDRTEELKKALGDVRGLSVLQGASREKRTAALHMGDEPPPAADAIPIWVRDQWSVTEKTVREDAQRAGLDSPVIHVFLPNLDAEALRSALASFGAAHETLATRPVPATDEGRDARASMESRERHDRALLTGLIEVIRESARVYQGGGTEVAAGSLRETVLQAMDASAARLYPDFGDADQKGWEKAVDQAVQGNGTPLKAVGYDGEVLLHPVARRIAGYLKTPRTGLQLRKHFGAPPFGWPQDAIDGGVLALIADNKVRAVVNGKPRHIGELKRPQIGQTEFVLEDSPPEMTHKFAVRRLGAAMVAGYKEGDDARAAQQVLDTLSELAQKAGGPSPLPPTPAPELLAELRMTQGGRRIIALAEHEATLKGWYAEWSALAKKGPERRARWDRLQRLLRVASSLPAYPEIAEQVAAIESHRLLLADPDPTESPKGQLAEGLRAALRGAHSAQVAARKQELDWLDTTPEWEALGPVPWRRILTDHNLGPIPDVSVGDDAAILHELEKQPLSAWADRTAALPSRAAAAHAAAVKLLQPEAAAVQPKLATLTDAAQADAYLDALRAEIMALLDEGRPVVITR